MNGNLTEAAHNAYCDDSSAKRIRQKVDARYRTAQGREVSRWRGYRVAAIIFCLALFQDPVQAQVTTLKRDRLKEKKGQTSLELTATGKAGVRFAAARGTKEITTIVDGTKHAQPWPDRMMGTKFAAHQKGAGAIVPWKNGAADVSDGQTVNTHRVEVRGTAITYYVNDTPIGSFENHLPNSFWSVGAFGCGQQQVCFRHVQVVDRTRRDEDP